MRSSRRNFLRTLGAAAAAATARPLLPQAQTQLRGPDRGHVLASYHETLVQQLQGTLGAKQFRQQYVTDPLNRAPGVSLETSVANLLPPDLQRVPLFLQRLQREGQGVVGPGFRAHLTDTRIGSGWGSPDYHAGVDLRGRHGIDEWEIEFGRQLLDQTQGMTVDHPRPLLAASYYPWFTTDGTRPVCGETVTVTEESWAPARSLPLRGLYRSTSVETNREQFRETHATGIDLMAVSSLAGQPFIDGTTDLALRSLPSFTRFFWLYEHVNPANPSLDLPLDDENGLTIINFGRTDVQEQFIADMLTLAAQFDRVNYFSITRGETTYYPVWMWNTHLIRDADAFVNTVQSARDAVRGRFGRELALVGGEPVQFPSGTAETLTRLRAFFAVTSYGIYTPFHAATFGLQLDSSYRTLTVNNMLRWFEIVEDSGVQSVYGGAAPEYWPPSQFSFSDTQGSPPLVSTTEQVEAFLELLQSQVIAPRRPRIVNHTSYNAHRDGDGIEPTYARRLAVGSFDYCDSGYNGAWDDLRSVLKFFGPSLFYRQAKLPALATGGASSLF